MPPSSPTRYKNGSKLEVDFVHRNVSQELIEITEDKLKILLNEYKEKVEKKKSWHTPLALVVAIVLVFTTTNFKIQFGISADQWFAIFSLLLIGCVIWLIIGLFGLTVNTKIDNLIEKIKNKTD